MYAFAFAMFLLMFITSFMSYLHRGFTNARIQPREKTCKLEYGLVFGLIFCVTVIGPIYFIDITSVDIGFTKPFTYDQTSYFSLYKIMENLMPENNDNYVFFNMFCTIIQLAIIPVVQLLVLIAWVVVYLYFPEIYESWGAQLDIFSNLLYEYSALDVAVIGFVLCCYNIDDIVEYIDEDLGIGLHMKEDIKHGIFTLYSGYVVTIYAILMTMKIKRFGWWFWSPPKLDEEGNVLQQPGAGDEDPSYNSFVNVL